MWPSCVMSTPLIKKKQRCHHPSPIFLLFGTGSVFLGLATRAEHFTNLFRRAATKRDKITVKCGQQALVGVMTYGPLKTSLFVWVHSAEVKHKSNSSHVLPPCRPLGKQAKGEKLNYPPPVCLLCPQGDPHSKTPGGLWTPTLGTTVLNGLSNCCVSESHMATGITESTCSEAPAGDTF